MSRTHRSPMWKSSQWVNFQKAALEGRVQLSLTRRSRFKREFRSRIGQRSGRGREAGTGAIISAILRGTRETVDRAILVEVRLEGSVHAQTLEVREEFSDVQLDGSPLQVSCLRSYFAA